MRYALFILLALSGVTCFGQKLLRYKSTASAIHYNPAARSFTLPVVDGLATIYNAGQKATSIDVYYSSPEAVTIQSSTDGGTTWVSNSASASPKNIAATPNIPVRLRIATVSKPGVYKVFPWPVMAGANTGKVNSAAFGDSNTQNGGNIDVGGADSTYTQFLTWSLDGSKFILPYANQGQGGEQTRDRYQFINTPGLVNHDNTNNHYDTTVSRNIFTVAFVTNDVGTYNNPVDTAFKYARLVDSSISKWGGYVIQILPARCYTSDVWPKMLAYGNGIKANPWAYYANSWISWYDNDTLNSVGMAPFAAFRNDLHYHIPGMRIQGRLLKPLFDSISNVIRIFPARPTGLTWNAGTQTASFTMGTGFIPSDYEYTLNWDGPLPNTGRIGATSKWVACTSTSINVTQTVAAGYFAVRVKSTPYNPPSPTLTSTAQFN